MTTLPVIAEHSDPVPPGQRGFQPYRPAPAPAMPPPVKNRFMQLSITAEQFRHIERSTATCRKLKKENKLLAVNNRALNVYAQRLETDLVVALSHLAVLEVRSQMAAERAMAAEDINVLKI